MTKWFGFGLVTIVTFAGCAAERQQAPAPAAAAAVVEQEGNGSIERTDVVTATATVEAIDYKKRLVTLLGPEGNSATIQVGPEVRNFAQVKKGDQVVATYRESVAVTLRKPGEAEPGVVAAEAVERAQPGAKPSGMAAETVTVTTTVEKVDRRKQVVTLKGPDGKTANVTVRDPARLEKVKVGDLVEITYTQALAISVEKASTK